MPGMNETATQLRMISPQELAALVTLHRQSLGWTQETLAEISGLTARTVQRVEKGEASSADTRRALARAFRMEDIDAFNKPTAFKSTEQLKKEAEELKKKHMTLPVSVAKTGKQLADVAEEINMRCFQQPDGVSQEVAGCVSCIFDHLSEYGEVHDLYTFSDKLVVHLTLDERLTHLSKAGFSMCYALRKTRIVGEDWVDKTPMPVSIGYVFVTRKGEEPKVVVVPKPLNVTF